MNEPPEPPFPDLPTGPAPPFTRDSFQMQEYGSRLAIAQIVDRLAPHKHHPETAELIRELQREDSHEDPEARAFLANQAVPQEVAEALRRGEREEAIRLYARLQAVDGATAREAIEAMEEMMEEPAPLLPPSPSWSTGFPPEGHSAMNPQPLPPDAAAALARGHKIEAIKLLREATGLGLAEAKHAVEAAARPGRRGTAAGAPAPATAPPQAATLAAVQQALRAGQTLEAIQLYRAYAGVGLKEAKDAVDAMARAPSAATLESLTANGLAPGEVPPSRGWWGWAIAAAAIGLALYWSLAR
jgi:ribosomal protein L7/L12